MKIWCKLCSGSGQIELDYGLWGEILKCDSCDGKGYTEVETTEIRTEYVSKEWGDQLKFAEDNPTIKFAVPESGVNEPSVDVVGELWNDINGYFFNKIVYNPVDEDAILLRDTKSDIEKIFEKYRK